MQDKVLQYFGSFCSTVSFAILNLGLFFARLPHGVGWIQYCDVIVFEKFHFHRPFNFLLWRAFSKTCVLGHRFSLDTCGRKANTQRKRKLRPRPHVFRLKTNLFLYGLAFCPHVSGENGDRKRNFSKTLSRVEIFENSVFVFSCGR